MTTTEFFTVYQAQMPQEFVEQLLTEIFTCAHVHNEKFSFEDLPF